MKILDMPNSSRPRERFLKVGPEGLSDAELFAILLRTGSRGKREKVNIEDILIKFIKDKILL